MTPSKIQEILEAHSRWLANEGGVRAYLRGANLTGTKVDMNMLFNAVLSASRWTREAGGRLGLRTEGIYTSHAYILP
jgi:hypothetical protein